MAKKSVATGGAVGNWVTINGAHVLIGANGKIAKGPAKYIGSTLADLGGKSSTSKSKSTKKTTPKKTTPKKETPKKVTTKKSTPPNKATVGGMSIAGFTKAQNTKFNKYIQQGMSMDDAVDKVLSGAGYGFGGKGMFR